VLIGGIIVQGTVPRPILVRALGPSLSVNPALQDPQLDVFDGQGTLLAHNDNWKEEPDGTANAAREARIIATGVPPTNDAEAAILFTADPGNYTAVVRGVANTTGISLLETYRLSP
jgi:hypothetical protein